MISSVIDVFGSQRPEHRACPIRVDAVEKIGKERAERLAGTFEGLFSAALAVPSANRVCSIYPQAV